MLEQVTDRFGDKIFITNVTDKTFDFTAKAAVSDALATWIMNYGANIEVIIPTELRDKIKNRAEKILEIYKKQQKTLAFYKALCYTISATVKVANNITHIMSYAGRGVTADTKVNTWCVT